MSQDGNGPTRRSSTCLHPHPPHPPLPLHLSHSLLHPTSDEVGEVGWMGRDGGRGDRPRCAFISFLLCTPGRVRGGSRAPLQSLRVRLGAAIMGLRPRPARRGTNPSQRSCPPPPPGDEPLATKAGATCPPRTTLPMQKLPMGGPQHAPGRSPQRGWGGGTERRRCRVIIPPTAGNVLDDGRNRRPPG